MKYREESDHEEEYRLFASIDEDEEWPDEDQEDLDDEYCKDIH